MDKRMKGLHKDDKRRLIWLRWIAVAEFVLANLGSIALVLLAVLKPVEVEVIRIVTAGLLVPMTIGGIALLLFYGKMSGRPWQTTLAELATWLVFPLPTVVMVFVFFAPT